MSKKIFAMLIAVALFVVSAPMQVLAADEENKDVKDVTEIKVTVASIADDSATITWDKLEKADGYEVTCNAVTETIGSDVLSYTMKGLAGSTEYTAEVKAYDSKHNVVGNGKCTFTTMAPGTPDEVEGFDTISSYLSVHLQWNKSDDADGYKIYWSGDDDTSGTIDIDNPSTTKYKFKIKEENREVNYTFKIAAVKNGLESMPVKKKDSAVQLMKLKITLRVNKVLQSHDKGKPATIKLKAGTTIKTIGFTNGKYVFQKKVKGKLRTFHVLRVAVKNPTINYIGKYKKSKGWNIVQPMYTKEEAEAFVNDLGVKSNTKHLIWVNQYSQRLYVFKGKKGSWKLIKQCYKDEDDGHAGWMVASGKPSSPTSTGLTNIKQRTPGGGGKVPFWNVTSWFSIHGNSPGPWGPLGWPKSGACCRNTTPHAKWIYQNTKMHTAVYVY